MSLSLPLPSIPAQVLSDLTNPRREAQAPYMRWVKTEIRSVQYTNGPFVE